MLSVNKINAAQGVTGIVPIFLSISYILYEAWWLLALCVLSLFVLLAVVPLFKKRESLCMFLLVAAAGLPLNIKLAYLFIIEWDMGLGYFFCDLCYGLLICCVLFSVEEVVLGVVTRLIWRRQYKIKIWKL